MGLFLTQGCFSFLPELTLKQIGSQIEFFLKKGYALSLEYTSTPHPRNCYWDMWGLPLFDISDPDAVLWELEQLRKSKPASEGYYIKLSAFNNQRGVESCVSSFIVQRPDVEVDMELFRHHVGPLHTQYSIVATP